MEKVKVNVEKVLWSSFKNFPPKNNKISKILYKHKIKRFMKQLWLKVII